MLLFDAKFQRVLLFKGMSKESNLGHKRTIGSENPFLILAVPLTSCVSLGKSLRLSEITLLIFKVGIQTPYLEDSRKLHI